MATSTIPKTVMSHTLNSATGTDADYLSATWELKRIGDIVFLTCTNLKGCPTGAFTESSKTIPADYRPKKGMYFTLYNRSSTPFAVALTISTAGTIAFHNYGSAFTGATPFNQVVSWPVV